MSDAAVFGKTTASYVASQPHTVLLIPLTRFPAEPDPSWIGRSVSNYCRLDVAVMTTCEMRVAKTLHRVV